MNPSKLVDVGVLLGLVGLLWFQTPRGADAPFWSPIEDSDWSCLGDLSQGRISEEKALPYPAYFERIPLTESQNVRFWVLYSEHPAIAESYNTNRGPASESSGPLEVREPLALLRDDNNDSHPDIAFLFRADREDPDVLSFKNFKRKGCDFWKQPVSTLLGEALAQKTWHMGLSRGHSWGSFLEKLAVLDPKEWSTQNSLSVIDEPQAHRLFELLAHSISSFGVESQNPEFHLEQTRERTEKIFSWLGIRHKSLRAPASQKELWVEGLKEPFQFKDYGAPFLYVNKDGRSEKAVFDILLFNDWTTESNWAQRVVQSKLK